MAAFMNNSTVNFSSDGTYAMVILSQTDNGTWELNTEGTILTTDKGTDEETIQTITTLTSDVLEFIESIDDEDYGTFDVTYRFVE